MPLDIVGIDLGHNQRHLGIHAEGMAVVDHDGAALDGLGQQLLGDIVAGGSEYNITALKGLGASLFDYDLLAHGSCRAQNSNRVLFHASPFKGCGFCPHAEQADYCCQCIQERGRHETRPVETKPKRNAPP